MHRAVAYSRSTAPVERVCSRSMQAEGAEKQRTVSLSSADIAPPAHEGAKLLKRFAVMTLSRACDDMCVPRHTAGLRFVVHVACSRHPAFSRAFDGKDGDMRQAMMMTAQVGVYGGMVEEEVMIL